MDVNIFDYQLPPPPPPPPPPEKPPPEPLEEGLEVEIFVEKEEISEGVADQKLVVPEYQVG